MTLNQYIRKLDERYKPGNSTEHTFRGDLQQLIEELVPEVRATNEPKRQKCGAPDYILTKNEIPVGFIEAKDIGDKDLDGTKKTGNKEQFDRYKASLNNLIFTDYVNFHFYRDGEFVTKIAIGEITGKGIRSLAENFEQFEKLIKDFCSHVGQTIKKSRKLAQMMAGKARLLADIIGKALLGDEENRQDSDLNRQMSAFKKFLIHDVTPKGFADVYAQTIAYGMFAARLRDPASENFGRQKAAELIPKSNPFLRKLFGHIAGPDIDGRIKWVVDNLSDIFLACDVKQILAGYGKSAKTEDPIIHFYETFLSEYDSEVRKNRGVWYTPRPVTSFIVRAVDDILKKEFGLKEGLADAGKTTIKTNTETTENDSAIGYKQDDQKTHKVQILDPATGTGTFLAETIKHIHEKFEGQEGLWGSYVMDHLLPRLNGFEVLMASYAMAHLNLDLLLDETGFNPASDQRFKVYLTNSLEESHPDTESLFANWLSDEANEANHIKRDTPVMCVIGNPPYSGESANKGDWITGLMEDYKKEPGGEVKLKEKNPKWINDDYVKFMRYGQRFIEKNGSGVLAFINPHGFLDNPTFRGMRWNLLRTYDKIYIIDLHGNARKKEKAPDGSADENVFDIQQGVSINLFIKTGKKKAGELGRVFHFDLYGKREAKHDFLGKNGIGSIGFKELPNVPPYYFFVPKDFKTLETYNKGFSLKDLFKENSLGVLSKNDKVTFNFNKEDLKKLITNFRNSREQDLKTEYDIKPDSRDWILSHAKEDLNRNYNEENFKCILYRPFDNRWTHFTGKSKGFFAYDQSRIMNHIRDKKNFALISGRQGQVVGNKQWNLSFITNTIVDQNIFYRGGGTVFPLYLYPETNGQQSIEQTDTSVSRKPNLNEKIVSQIAGNLGLTFTNEKGTSKDDTFAPIDLLDYIYAVLHSPAYREKYKEFLKINFPRVPYPKDKETFWKLAGLGKELRDLHLLESPAVKKHVTQYRIKGGNVVDKPMYKDGKVYINDTQHFDKVPQTAWEFYIGGYRPAQKWLRDRKGRTLGHDDILRYQEIIVALTETDRLMKIIDGIDVV